MGVPPRPRRTRRTGSAEDQGGFAVWRIYFGMIVTKPLPLGDVIGVARGRAEVDGGAQNPRHLRSPSFGGALGPVAVLATLALAVALATLVVLALALAVALRLGIGVGLGVGVRALVLVIVLALVGVAPGLVSVGRRMLRGVGGGRHARMGRQEVRAFQPLHEGHGRPRMLDWGGHASEPPVHHSGRRFRTTVRGHTNDVIPWAVVGQGERIREALRDRLP